MINKTKNKYYKRSRISEHKFREILRCFCSDMNAEKTASFCRVNRNTVNRIFFLLRERIFLHSLEQEKKEKWEFEVDESYFWARRVRGKRWRWAAWKTPVFGILKRDGKVHVSIVRNCSRAELLPIIEWKILEWSTIHSDGWKAYDGLVLNGYDHYRVFHSHNEFARWKSHINWIESFWSFTKRRLSKFNWLTDDMFIYHLKESEFRWNLREKDMYIYLMKLLRKTPLN